MTNSSLFSPSDLCYVDPLTKADINTAQSDSHDFWGEGRTLSKRIEELNELMNFQGPELLRYVGLKSSCVSPNAHLLSSFKRYGLCLHHPELGLLNGLGIGAVFTPQLLRGHGLAKKMLELALQKEKDQGSDFAFLFSDIGTNFYEQLGFIPIKAKNWKLALSRLPFELNNIHYRELGPNEEAWARDLYNQNNQKLNRPYLFRNPNIWAFYRKRNSLNNDFVLEIKNAKALVNFKTIQKTLMIQEIALDHFPIDALWPCLKKIAQERNCDTIEGWETNSLNLSSISSISFSFEEKKEAIPMILPLKKDLTSASALSWSSVQFGMLDHF